MVNRLGWKGIGSLLAIPLLILAQVWLDFRGFYFSLLLWSWAITWGLFGFIYFMRLRASEGFFEHCDNHTASFIFSNQGVKTESQIGTTEFKWQIFDELLKFPDVWLLVYVKSGYITLPTIELSTECKHLIEKNIPKHEA
jgi:hypothetical protein